MTDPPRGPTSLSPMGHTLLCHPWVLWLRGQYCTFLNVESWEEPSGGEGDGRTPRCLGHKAKVNSKLIGGGKETRLGSLSLRQLDSFLISM